MDECVGGTAGTPAMYKKELLRLVGTLRLFPSSRSCSGNVEMLKSRGGHIQEPQFLRLQTYPRRVMEFFENLEFQEG